MASIYTERWEWISQGTCIVSHKPEVVWETVDDEKAGVFYRPLEQFTKIICEMFVQTREAPRRRLGD